MIIPRRLLWRRRRVNTCCPVVPALECEILTAQPQAAAFDCRCSGAHGMFTFMPSRLTPRRTCGSLGFDICIGSCGGRVEICAQLSRAPACYLFFISTVSPDSIQFKPESQFPPQKNANIDHLFARLYTTKVRIWIHYLELKRWMKTKLRMRVNVTLSAVCRWQISDCSSEGMFRAFSQHVLHRLNIPRDGPKVGNTSGWTQLYEHTNLYIY